MVSASGRPREVREVLGRCHFCGIAYRWLRTKAHTLKAAFCPVCGGKLTQTTHHFRGPWVERVPLFDYGHAAELRRARPGGRL